MNLRKRLLHPDVIAVLSLVLLWLLFFWRLLTPVAVDQVSMAEGDFSAQFLAFGAYQYERLSSGEIPLWNPYNNGGLPFIADPQAAVFYPPRLLTIAISSLVGGWSYNALQMEVIAHVLLYSLLMYAFGRRLTIESDASPYAAFVSAIIAGYGGFMTGYPLLQLAILEAGTWLPLALLGVLEAGRRARIGWRWLALAGWALGVSWLAGHPQTGWLATLAVAAYLAWQLWLRRESLIVFVRRFAAALALLGLITAGVAAVQLLPAAEYLSRTMRSGLGFDAKSSGFPFQDLVQVVIPGSVSAYSPLWIGISGLVLAAIGIFGKHRDRLFFGGLALIALVMSFGGNSVFYHIVYHILPGASAFRSQERAAFLVVNAMTTLAGLGTVTVLSRPETSFVRAVRRALTRSALLMGLLAGGIVIAWLAMPSDYGVVVGPATFSLIIAACMVLLLPVVMTGGQRSWRWMLMLLVVFEIFSVTIDNRNVFEPVPVASRSYLQPPYLVKRVHDDAADGAAYRVDGGIVRGAIGIYGLGNSGSAYRLADIRGISPLFLDGPHAIIMREMPAEVAWELFAVRYVFTDAEELPVESTLIARDYPKGETLNLHRLEDARPFVHLVYDAVVVESDEAARDLMRDSDFDLRNTVILAQQPDITLPDTPLEDVQAEVTSLAPEALTINVSTSENAILTVAQVDYPGWTVHLDDETIEPIRAYGALTAIPIPAGTHTVTYRYQPLAFRVGAAFSAVTWAGLLVLAVFAAWRRMGQRSYA